MMYPLLDDRRIVFATILELENARFFFDRESVWRFGLGRYRRRR